MHAAHAPRPQTPPPTAHQQAQEREEDQDREHELELAPAGDQDQEEGEQDPDAQALRASAALHPLPFQKEVSSPDRFPRPFRHRPPGQFHLPWTPPATPGPESRALPAAAPASASAYADGSFFAPAYPASPATPATPASPAPGPGESVTLKAVLNESIVLLRVARGAPLADVRQRLRDKFAAQEGVQLSRAFVVGWAPAGSAGGVGGLRGRPRANSASSVGALSPQALRYVYTEDEWAAALAACVGGKMTIRLFNAQAI